MSAVTLLTADDFFLETTTEGVVLLRLKIPGIAVVLFYSPQGCAHSQRMKDVFLQTSKTLLGCRYGVVNVLNDFELVRSTHKTSFTKIEFVPYVLFFNQSTPFTRYSGPPDIEAFRQFVAMCANRCTTNFANNPASSSNSNPKCGRVKPEFSIGFPIIGDNENVSYITFDNYNTPQLATRR